MSNLVSNGRGLILVAVAVALLTTSGCSWLRGQSGYELSPESRPLEIPPDLDAPAIEAGLRIPEIPATAPSRSNMSGAFVLQDTPMGAYGRVGIALSRIEGVTISERSQLLTVYTVSYEGETFLIRIAADKDDGARVVAATTDGREISAGAGARLLGLLRERLG